MTVKQKKRKRMQERVQLRDDQFVRVRIMEGRHWDDEYHPYAYRGNAELDAILASINGDATAALASWFRLVEPRLLKQRGVILVPGPIQERLGLPVRQVYLYYGMIYRIEPGPGRFHGRVTQRLL